MHILLTRPIDQARATAERLRAAGHDMLFAPMLKIEALDPPTFPTDDIAAIAATSARIADVLPARPEFPALQSLPVFAVGARTADALHKAGFASVKPAAGDAASLGKTLVDARPRISGPILYPCGHDRRSDLESRLVKAGFTVRPVELYAAKKQKNFPDEIGDALKGHRIDAVLIYSRRTAEAFVKALQTAGIKPQGLRILAISSAAAEPLAAVECPVFVAETPDETGLMALLRA
ncbi:uroporphyrinogen-III synthase [Breoghania sp.]|uniref:uroporphyrinogen-III synthase n=1 Tax=Breoghania sp. TaxID=2065378 RepID=UPI002631BA49|nr:uroporphyrinogen-III synthase [Breoghania sp.]MDJ0930499.1 uroporphyrinogen-III synthase [Breoghania sp.]